MQLGAAGKALIQSFESCKMYAYQDQRGIWTIGWGHVPAVEYQTCTQADADAWFDQDTHAAVNAVNRTVDVGLNQNQFDALVAFAYNVGVNALKNSTLLKKVNKNPQDVTIRNEF